MTDLICRKSMTRCMTPGMCSPHGGCQAPETASAFRTLMAERNSLAFLLKRFVDGEHDQDENQAERHMYHDEAKNLLAYLGGELHGHTLVPDESQRALKAERDVLRKGLTDVFNHVEGDTECLVRDLVNWGTTRINPNDFYGECEKIKALAIAALEGGGV